MDAPHVLRRCQQDRTGEVDAMRRLSGALIEGVAERVHTCVR